LTIQNLTFTYPEASLPALEDISLSVDAGEFFVLYGRSGCGKSTLLRQIKPQLAPHGEKSGNILFEGVPVTELSDRESAAGIGFVLQSPDHQIVTDKVWHELAFGLESLGCDTPSIRRRVAEMASFFGIQNWFYQNVSALSGGQKQLLNLASVMVMQPRILILDEPTSQLDPIAATDFLATLQKINRELGTTILLTEHRLEEALSLATRAAVMEQGRLLCSGTAAETGAFLRQGRHPMFFAMPAAMRIWGAVDSPHPCPVSVREGRRFLTEYAAASPLRPLKNHAEKRGEGKVKIVVQEACFRYEKEGPDVMSGVCLSARAGELLCLLGGNGTGKTTTLKVLSGLYRPHRGEVIREGSVGLLPQSPQTLFVKKTVMEELAETLSGSGLSREEKREKVLQVVRLCRLSGLEERHPYDLSGGEQQRAALAKLLILNPDILLLDEPTKGMDAVFKAELAAILKGLLRVGVCIVMVSHDLEFCAKYADRCVLFFDGSIAAEGTPREFFAGNSFYTTSANRIARHLLPDAVTAEEVIEAMGGEAAEEAPTDTEPESAQRAAIGDCAEEKHEEPPRQPASLPLWRKIGGLLCGLLSIGLLIPAVKTENLNELVDRNGITAAGRPQLYLYGALILLLLLTAAFVSRRAAPPVPARMPQEKRRLSKRTLAAVVLILLVVPVTLWIGVVYIDRKQYYLTALAVLMECMLPFFMVFEGRHPKARELVVIAVLCALGVAGRAAFFMLPQFKPVLALTLIAGVAFGGETGFLVGAVTMLVSNILFSQGPWTPWQMFAMGMIGFLSGVLYRKGWLRRTRLSLCIWGILSAVLIYGGIMNPTSAFIWGGESLNGKMIAGYYLTGFPMDCLHAASTAAFLWFIAEPLLEKLDRIKVKYGLVE
ncbi:MAG: ATP-binding cassette domain-containing protein, partial [Clostridiales bacterium]|nr:ATP-binding cassette domain-containing protein [Clostridiales bacterium]